MPAAGTCQGESVWFAHLCQYVEVLSSGHCIASALVTMLACAMIVEDKSL